MTHADDAATVRRAFRGAASYDDFRAADAALARMKAEHAQCPFCLFVPIDLDELAAHLNNCSGRKGYGGIDSLEQVERAEQAEARVTQLEAELERIAWHELTWQEARDVARAATQEPTP